MPSEGEKGGVGVPIPPFEIPPPPADVSSEPDASTKKGQADMTGSEAPERILHINIGCFKYGTADKAHAAAVAISLFLMIVVLLVAMTAAISSIWAQQLQWISSVLTGLISALTFTIGIAVGQSTKKSDKPSGDDKPFV
jgi:hypothetical protein